MPTRTFSTKFSTVGSYFNHYSSGSGSSFSIGKVTSVAGSCTTGDTRGRDWRQMIANGQTVTSDLDVSCATFSGNPSTGTQTQKKLAPALVFTEQYNGYPFDDLVGSSMWSGSASNALDRARNQAVINFSSNAKAVTTSFQGMVAVGELPELIRTIRNPARGVRDLLSHYLNRVKKHGRRGLTRKGRRDAVRSQWLETQYAIRPLVHDIDDGMEALRKSKYHRPIFKMVRGYGSQEGSPVITTSTYAPLNGISMSYTRVGKSRGQCKYYGVLGLSGVSVDIPQLYGFRFEEFAPTLWELLPWSFVADYFSNIGSVIEAWSYRSALPGSVVVTTVSDLVVEFKPSSGPLEGPPMSGFSRSSYSLEPASLTATKRVISRRGNASVPLPSFEARVPGTSTKWINLAALASQLRDARSALR